MSPDSLSPRFFGLGARVAEREASRMCQAAEPGRAALLALSGDEIVGCASYEPAPGGQAEISFAVADRMHHRGIATLLLEHLVSRARQDGIQALVAETLAENTAMLRVLAEAGLPVRKRFGNGVTEVTIPVPRDDTDTALDVYLSAVDRREGSRLYAVNPHARYLGGVRCVPTVAELPEAPELAVIAIPPAGVIDAAEACGAKGVKAMVVITAGLEVQACADLLAICRRHGMSREGPGDVQDPGALQGRRSLMLAGFRA